MYDHLRKRSNPHESMGLANSEALVQRYREQTEAQDELRVEMRGIPEPLPAEGWISALFRMREPGADQGDFSSIPGIMCYRLTYQQSEEEWTAFLRMLEADLADSGDGEAGAEEIRASMTLQWLDGRDLDIGKSRPQKSNCLGSLTLCAAWPWN